MRSERVKFPCHFLLWQHRYQVHQQMYRWSLKVQHRSKFLGKLRIMVVHLYLRIESIATVELEELLSHKSYQTQQELWLSTLSHQVFKLIRFTSSKLQRWMLLAMVHSQKLHQVFEQPHNPAHLVHQQKFQRLQITSWFNGRLLLTTADLVSQNTVFTFRHLQLEFKRCLVIPRALHLFKWTWLDWRLERCTTSPLVQRIS